MYLDYKVLDINEPLIKYYITCIFNMYDRKEYYNEIVNFETYLCKNNMFSLIENKIHNLINQSYEDRIKTNYEMGNLDVVIDFYENENYNFDYGSNSRNYIMKSYLELNKNKQQDSIKVLEVFIKNKDKDKDLKFDGEIYNHIQDIINNTNFNDLLESNTDLILYIYALIESKQLKITHIKVYLNYIDYYFNKKNYQKAIKTYSLIDHNTINIENQDIYQKIIISYCELSEYQEIINIYNNLCHLPSFEIKKLSNDIKKIIMISYYETKTNDIIEIYESLSCNSFFNNIYMYEELMIKYYEMNKYNNIIKIHNIIPKDTVFSTEVNSILFKVYHEKNQIHKMDNLYNNISNDLKDLMVLDNAIYHNLLNFNQKNDKIIIDIYNEMKKKQIEPLPESWSFILKAIFKQENYRSFVSMYEIKCQTISLTLENYIYNYLVQSYLELDIHDKSYQIYKNYIIPRNIILYESIYIKLIKYSDISKLEWEDVIDIYNNYLEKQINKDTYSIILKAFYYKKNFKMANQILREAIHKKICKIKIEDIKIDFHGVSIPELHSYLYSNSDNLKSDRYILICGKGNHSVNNECRIKEAIIVFCKTKNIDWKIDNCNEGRILIN